MGGGAEGCVPPVPPRANVPVELGALHQRVGVPVPNEGAAVEAAEALGVVFLLPGHLRTMPSALGPPVWALRVGPGFGGGWEHPWVHQGYGKGRLSHGTVGTEVPPSWRWL